MGFKRQIFAVSSNLSANYTTTTVHYLNIQTRGSITVRLTSSLTGLDLTRCQKVVSLNPDTVYIFTLICCKNCNVWLKRLKIKKETGIGQFVTFSWSTRTRKCFRIKAPANEINNSWAEKTLLINFFAASDTLRNGIGGGRHRLNDF